MAQIVHLRSVRPEDDDFWTEVACHREEPHPVDPANSLRRVLREMGLILGAVGAAILLTSWRAHADPLPVPAMSASLAANPDPYRFDLDWAGNWVVGGALTGLAYDQDNPDFGVHSQFDLSNGQAWMAKTDGWWQFTVQAGAYSLPSLGAGYVKSPLMPALSYGDVPVAFVKIVPGDGFSIQAGKLPTLIGGEYTFTFENLNIQRGLLWNQEPAISNGVQANYSGGPFSLSVSWNDGFYSKRLNWISGLVSYAFSGSDTIAVVAGGGPDSSIYNLLYTHAQGPWTISPYAQYVRAADGSSSAGAALLVNYAFDDRWKLAGRVEYAGSDGSTNIALAGPGSSAWSVTLTPTYQYQRFFARLEGSYVGASDIAPGFAYGPAFDRDSQTSVFFESGVLL